MPAAPSPMLATTGPLPGGPGWAFEFKWDGVRAIAVLAGGTTRLYARSGAEITTAYPELTGLGGQLPDGVLDGEIVALDAAGRPSFVALAERMHVRDRVRAARLAATVPVTYMIFDLLRRGDEDLTGWAYARRRAALEDAALGGSHWVVPPTFTDGPATVAASRANSLEGVVAKRLASHYRPGVRSPDWIKLKLDVTADFVVGGYRPGKRALGSLLVGVPTTEGGLAFRGRVGGGISAASERELLGLLAPLRTTTSPFATPVPREDARGAVWVRPELVVELKYGQRTPDGRLRFPRFVRLRPDKPPHEVVDEAVDG